MKFIHLLPILACALLAACSPEPSEQEISDALQSTMDQAKAQIGALGNTMVPTIRNVRKIGCKSADQGGYACDIEYDVSGGLTSGSRHVVNSGRMVKSSKGWTFMMQLER